ncbi:alpha/beta fold hydrolase [Pseudomonas neuropathica]|uniref:alpha/beta fold hydrolase n=1 Tax=Pseudomonas neuropathica TaxID=2730425 RepID=UPI003EC0A796
MTRPLLTGLAIFALSLMAQADVIPFPANFHTQDIKVDGATLHVRVGGKGPAVVLLHGFGDTGDMWAKFAGNPAKVDEGTRQHYAKLYARPGAMYAAFAQFRSIRQDALDNAPVLQKHLSMPVLAVGGEKSFGNNEAIVMRNAADNVTEVVIPAAGHWLMEEAPAPTIKAVRDFIAM